MCSVDDNLKIAVAKLAEKEENIVILRTEKDKSEATVKYLQDQFNVSQKEKEAFQIKISDFEKHCNNLSEKLMEVESQIESFQNQNHSLLMEKEAIIVEVCIHFCGSNTKIFRHLYVFIFY